MSILALSSGESELGALIKASTEGLGLQAVLQDFQVKVNVKVLSDATAAIGMARRLGLGRVRHLATADLWVQQRVRAGELHLAKYPSRENGADLMTKPKCRSEILRLMENIGFKAMSGRPIVAPRRDFKWFADQPATVGPDLARPSPLDMAAWLSDVPHNLVVAEALCC